MELKAYEWLTATVKKPETWGFPFVIICVIGGLLVFSSHIYYSHGIVPYLITVPLWPIVIFISLDISSQRADLEKWVYASLQSEWKFIERPLSTLLAHISFVLLFEVTRFMVFIITRFLLIGLVFFLVFFFGWVLWISGDRDISKFGENINNYMSIILVFIFLAQAGIFYQQYCHMKQPFFKAPLLWALSKSNSDTDCCILLKNGGNVPIFDVLYQVSEVLVKDIWGYKITKSEEMSKYFLPRLDSGSEKEIFENHTEEFKEMRLAVYLSAKTLEGHSTRLFFYKAPGDMDFRLAGSAHT